MRAPSRASIRWLHSNADGRSYHPTTKAEAIAIASSMIARGGRPDLGFMQINAANLNWLGLSITQAFDLCPSIAASARILHGGYDPCVDAGGDAQACLRIAASTYNTGSPTRGFANGYVHLIAATAAHVIPAIAVAGQQPNVPAAAAPAPKPLPCIPPSPDDRLVGRELGLSKNTVADIVKRDRAVPTSA